MSFPFVFFKNEFHRPCLAVFIIEKYLFLSDRKALWLWVSLILFQTLLFWLSLSLDLSISSFYQGLE